MHQIDGMRLLGDLGIDHLKDASTFGALSDAALQYLLVKGRVYALAPGDTLFEAGAAGDSFFVILQGAVDYYRCLNGHLEKLRDYRFGEEIGFVSMVALTERKGTAIATTDCLAIEIDHDLFYDLHCRMPLDFGLLSMNLAREMARTILTYTEMLTEERKNRALS